MTVLKNKVDLILCNSLRSIYSRVDKNIVNENWYHFSIKTTVIINNIRLIFRFDPNSKSVMPNMNYVFNIQAISIFVFLFIFGRRKHIEIWYINIHSIYIPTLKCSSDTSEFSHTTTKNQILSYQFGNLATIRGLT